jgi:hypothetical protein
LRFVPNYILRGGCEKYFLGASRQIKFGLAHLFHNFQNKISKNIHKSKEYFVAAGGENLFTQPLKLETLKGQAITVVLQA